MADFNPYDISFGDPTHDGTVLLWLGHTTETTAQWSTLKTGRHAYSGARWWLLSWLSYSFTQIFFVLYYRLLWISLLFVDLNLIFHHLFAFLYLKKRPFGRFFFGLMHSHQGKADEGDSEPSILEYVVACLVPRCRERGGDTIYTHTLDVAPS